MSAIHHVSLETRREDVFACVEFYARLGFGRVPVPDERLASQGVFLQGGPTQIHLLFADDPVVPPAGHVALALDDYDGVLEALRAAGIEVSPRTEYWGAARAKVVDPAGHVVELMAGAPPSP